MTRGLGRRALRRACFAALALALPIAARVALADGEGTRRAVELSLTGQGEGGIVETTRELVGRLGLSLELAGERPSGDALVRASVDLRDPGVARVTVVDVRSGATLVVRAVPRGAAAVVAEEVAHVIQAAAESALATARAVEAEAGADAAPDAPDDAPPEAAAPDSAPEPLLAAPDAGPPAESPRAKGFAIDALALVDGSGFADAAGVIFGAGGGARLAFGRAMWRPSILLTAIYHPAVGAVTPAVELRTTVTSIRVMPALALLDTRWVGVDVGLGLGLDVVDVAPYQGRVPIIVPAGGSTLVDPIVRGGAGVELRALPWAALYALVSADMDLQPHNYVVDRGGTATTALEPWRVRPSVLVGVRIALFEPKGAR